MICCHTNLMSYSLLVNCMINNGLTSSSQLLLRFTAIVLVACLANYWLFIPTIVIVLIQLLFRWFFLHTSRSIKRLEALGKEHGFVGKNRMKYFSLQLAVHYTHTSHPLFKACLLLGLTRRRRSFLIAYIITSMNTLRHGTCTLLPIDGLEWGLISSIQCFLCLLCFLPFLWLKVSTP